MNRHGPVTHFARHDPCHLVWQVNQIPWLDRPQPKHPDPCRLVRQVNQILRLAATKFETNSIRTNPREAGASTTCVPKRSLGTRKIDAARTLGRTGGLTPRRSPLFYLLTSILYPLFSTMPPLASLLDQIAHPRILVLGDLILDKYTSGNAERVSPEAPVIVLRVDGKEVRLGGAASVALLLRGLEAEVTLAGV